LTSIFSLLTVVNKLLKSFCFAIASHFLHTQP
jgi:hypothetical protein